jgi:hypothetical protein
VRVDLLEGVAVRQIPALGQCGWLSMALVYLALVSGAALAGIDAAAEVLEDLKRRMVEKLERDPSDFENIVCGRGCNTIAEYQHKILYETYQTEHLDLHLLSAVIGINIRVVSPDQDDGCNIFASTSGVLPEQWCVLVWKGRSHYDLVYRLDSSTQQWTPLLSEEHAASVELETALRSLIVRQHELDLARRAEEDSASMAAIEATHLSEVIPSSILDERMDPAAATTSTDMPSSSAVAVAAVVSSHDERSPQNSAAPATPIGDVLASSGVASSSPGETESHAAAHCWRHDSAHTLVVADFVLCLCVFLPPFSEFETWKATQSEDVQRELFKYQEQLRLGQQETWVAQLRIALSLYGIREIMRRHAGSRVAPDFLDFLKCCFPKGFQKRNDMLHRISKMASTRKVKGRFISDLPFLWSLVGDPPVNSRISWNYLTRELPALLERYRNFCPTTGEPICMYAEVRQALTEKRMVSCCSTQQPGMHLSTRHPLTLILHLCSAIGVYACRSADHGSSFGRRHQPQRA